MKVHRIMRAVGLGLAMAAVAAGGAQAAERPDDRGGMLGVGAAQAVATPDAFERAALRATESAPPDAFERAVLRHSTQVAERPDDRLGIRGPGAVAPTLSVSVKPVESGFQWDDALFGAAGMFGVVLLGTAVTLTIRHRGGVILR
jgi:hypothetical protein